MSRPGIEPVTSRSPERTLYLLSYRGRTVESSVPISICVVIALDATVSLVAVHFLVKVLLWRAKISSNNVSLVGVCLAMVTYCHDLILGLHSISDDNCVRESTLWLEH